MKKAFVSYDADRHGNLKHLVKAWEDSDPYFQFNDHSIDTSINSMNVSYIKSRIREAIRNCDVFIVIVGDYTSSNKWVNWECQVAREFWKTIKVIKVKPYFLIPNSIYGYYRNIIYNGSTKANWDHALNY